MEGYDEVSTHVKTRYLATIFHAKCLAVATRYLVHGKYVVRGVGVVIYAFTSRFVKEKAARQMRLFQSVPSKFAKEVTNIF